MNANANINESKKKGRPVYLDYQATTPMDPWVVEAMAPFFGDKFGNPHSRNYFYGWDAEEAVKKARRQIADLIGAEEREIVFTSGATESNNLGIKGIARFHKENKNHIVTVATEHKCVLESCAALEREGFGRFPTTEEVDLAAATLTAGVEHLRRVNPRRSASAV